MKPLPRLGVNLPIPAALEFAAAPEFRFFRKVHVTRRKERIQNSGNQESDREDSGLLLKCLWRGICAEPPWWFEAHPAGSPYPWGWQAGTILPFAASMNVPEERFLGAEKGLSGPGSSFTIQIPSMTVERGVFPAFLMELILHF